MSPEQAIERANQAARLLDDPTLQKAFEGVRMALLSRLEDVALIDRDTQHEIAVSLQLLKQLKRQLHTWVTDGKLEVNRAETSTLWPRNRA
jgi:hypothetical protein